ncbi:hypothetical protein [Xanthomonas sp. 60]
MKTYFRIGTAAALLMLASQALAQTTPQVCRENFARSEASRTCIVSGVVVPPGSTLCQMQIACRRNDGSYRNYNGAFNPHQLPNYCNRNGELVLGCAPRP